MRFSFTVNVAGVERVMHGIAENARDLDEALKAYGSKWLRHSVQRRFDQQGPGWPERKPETLRRIVNSGGVLTGAREDRARGRLARKLQSELRRARRNRDRLDDPVRRASEEARQRARASQGKRYRSMAQILASKESAVRRREAMLDTFNRVVAAAQSGQDLQVANKAEGKRVATIAARMGRAQSKASGPMLGKIASSFSMKVANNTLTYASRIPWAGAHDGGATAGHGAKLPPRPFAFLDDRDLEVLVDMLVAHLGHNVTVD